MLEFIGYVFKLTKIGCFKTEINLSMLGPPSYITYKINKWGIIPMNF